jgi:hypothetical protein
MHAEVLGKPGFKVSRFKDEQLAETFETLTLETFLSSRETAPRPR